MENKELIKILCKESIYKKINYFDNKKILFFNN